MRRFVAIVVVLCAVAPTQAKDMRPWSLRELTYRADAVVVAVPVDGPTSGHFKVTKVLRGGAKIGATISLTEADRNLYGLAAFAVVEPEEAPPAPVEALLFLAAPVEPGKPCELLSSGLLLTLVDGSVLAPRQLNNPGGFTMTVQQGRFWPTTVKSAATAAATVDEVLRLKAAVGKERAVGLLKWIERHRLEFGGGFHDDDRAGWGSLETEVFDWACAQGRPEDCWTAVRLYAELNRGAVLPVKGPYFGTNAGRDFLFQIVLNERRLDGDRARALTLLAHPRTLNPTADANHPAVTPCNDADLVMLIQKLSPLLEVKSEVVRNSATAALHSIQLARGADATVRMELQNTLPALQRVYQAEQPGPFRDQLVEMIYTIGGVDHWKEVSGSKTGLAVLLRDFGKTNEQVTFWLQVLPGTEKIYERPTLVLERVDGKGKVLETKTMPLPVVNGPRWEDGWTPGDLLLVQFSNGALTSVTPQGRPGRGPKGDNPAASAGWRVSVRGTVGKEKVAWTSEPKMVASRPQRDPEEMYDMWDK